MKDSLQNMKEYIKIQDDVLYIIIFRELFPIFKLGRKKNQSLKILCEIWRNALVNHRTAKRSTSTIAKTIVFMSEFFQVWSLKM